MLVGLIADVHSNVVALKAVLSEMDALGVEKILHAGDIVGYNPYPNETIGLFKKRKIISIRGNHDRALATEDISGFNPYAAKALDWTGKVITRENLGFISRLKDVEAIRVEDTKIVIVHGSPKDFDEYVYPEDVEPEFLTITDSDKLVLGHTHVQFNMEFPGGTVINPGSVGQPRDLDPDSAFAILDTDTMKIQLKRKKYDIEKVIEDMQKAHLPEKLAFRLRDGT
ncbi:MAG: metallophosphoesterase family protein [Candidatus Methanoperedens sp.]|nr:metallophosphoesterase family protein [Candidatus Methanoperedens sp.]